MGPKLIKWEFSNGKRRATVAGELVDLDSLGSKVEIMVLPPSKVPQGKSSIDSAVEEAIEFARAHGHRFVDMGESFEKFLDGYHRKTRVYTVTFYFEK